MKVLSYFWSMKTEVRLQRGYKLLLKHEAFTKFAERPVPDSIEDEHKRMVGELANILCLSTEHFDRIIVEANNKLNQMIQASTF